MGAGRVPALPPAAAAMLLVMTPETDSKCVCVSQKIGFGENTQTPVITARSRNKNLCFMASLREQRCTLFSLLLVISYYQVKAKIIETRDISDYLIRICDVVQVVIYVQRVFDLLQ